MALPKERIGISFTELLKATMAGGLLFLLPVALIAIVLEHAMQLVGKIVTLGRDCHRSTGADPGLVGRWPRCPHECWQAHYALV